MKSRGTFWQSLILIAGLWAVTLSGTGCESAQKVMEAVQSAQSAAQSTKTDASEANESGADGPVSFEAYIKEGENFGFTFDPKDVVSYEELRKGEFKDSLSMDNWDTYFEVRDVYWEHMEYDDEGKETTTFMKGLSTNIMLKDEYLFVDNRSKNGAEISIHVVADTEHVTYNDGITYDPIREHKDEVQVCSGDDIIIFKDFYDSWDEITNETDTGTLESYEVVDAAGDLFLIDSSLVKFKKYADDIYYFAAYGAPDEYFVIFVQTEDETLDYYKEYDGAVYVTSGYRQNQRYTGIQKLVINEWLKDCFKKVNEE